MRASDTSQHFRVHIITCLLQGPRVLLEYFEASNAGPYNENSLLGVPSEVNTGENIGQGEKVNVCKFPLGSVNNWEVHESPSGACTTSCNLIAHIHCVGSSPKRSTTCTRSHTPKIFEAFCHTQPACQEQPCLKLNIMRS